VRRMALEGARRWRLVMAGSLAILAVALASLAPYLRDSAELVRMRNALLLDRAPAQVEWSPDRAPADFARERAAPSPAFQARVAALGLDAVPGDWPRAMALGRHLLAARRAAVGQPIQSDLETTYSRIRATGEGYCGDYADVFTALALAAGLEVRSWAFSFDGFGGRGHIFNEVWDRASGTWRMIDVFHNYVMTDAAGEPMSALAFRDAMRRGGEDVRFDPIDPAAKPVFRYEVRARDFYARGLDQWYLWWGNNVYSYDQAALVRAFGGLSRSAEQLGAIVQAVHPRIRVLAEPANDAMRTRMFRLQVHLWIVAWAVGLALVVAGAAAAALWRGRRSPGARA
jgi:hypothetical protein